MIYSENPIHNIIDGEIKGGVRVCFDHQKYGSALKLIYSGIDVMAFLSMPAERISVKKSHFVKWAEKYIIFPGQEQLSGEEMYDARSELLHTHRPKQIKNPNDRSRMIVYEIKGARPIISKPHVNRQLVVVSVFHLMQAFFSGIDQFLIDVYQDTERAKIIEKRFTSLFSNMPYPDEHRK